MSARDRTAAERMRRYRRRQRRDEVPVTLSVSMEAIAILLDAGKITERQALDRRALEAVFTALLADAVKNRVTP